MISMTLQAPFCKRCRSRTPKPTPRFRTFQVCPKELAQLQCHIIAHGSVRRFTEVDFSRDPIATANGWRGDEQDRVCDVCATRIADRWARLSSIP